MTEEKKYEALDKELRFIEVNVDQDRALNRISDASIISIEGKMPLSYAEKILLRKRPLNFQSRLV